MREFALPGARARYAPDRVCDIEHIAIDVTVDVEKRRIAGSCSLTFKPIAADLSWLVLDAVELGVTRVSSNDLDLDFRYDGKKLRVHVGDAASLGQSAVITVDYSAAPRRGLYFVGPDDGYPDKPTQVWTQGQDEDSRYWFPCFDAPHEKATSSVRVTVPKGWFALSNGGLVEDKKTNASRTLAYELNHIHSAYLITLAAGQFAEIRDEWDGIEVLYFVEPGREEEAKRTLGKTPEMLELFSRLFGVRYPYESYAQIFVGDFIFGGMENTTATTLTDTVLLDQRASLDFDVESLVAHELAHQWFGDLLTCRSWSEGWLNEGFATYSEYLWREHSEGRDAAALELEIWGEQYFTEDSARYRRPVATNVYDEPIDVFDHHLYEKGGRILHMLRRVLGDEPFWQAITHYLNKHRLGSVETRDLARAVEDSTGRVLDWFFDQWISKGSGHPELSVEYKWDDEKKVACLTIKQTQKIDRDTPLFRLPTQVRFRIGKTDIDFDVELTEERHTFYFPLDEEPTQVIFDPGKHLLAVVKTQKPTPLWNAELKSATEAIDRIYAARQLGSSGHTPATESLKEALTLDPFWGLKAAAAEALGQLRTTEARDVLLKSLGAEKHPKARRGIVRALGEFRHDEAVARRLTKLIETGDVSYFVTAEACLALGKTRAEIAKSVLRKAADTESFFDVIRQNAYRGLAEARDESAHQLLLDGTEYGQKPHGRAAALRALATLAKGRRDRDATRVRERMEELLFDPDFRTQCAALEALATLGDPAAATALGRVVSQELDGRLRRRAREVMRDLEEGRAQGEQITGLQERLEATQRELTALTERLTKMEKSPTQIRKKGGGKKTIAKR